MENKVWRASRRSLSTSANHVKAHVPGAGIRHGMSAQALDLAKPGLRLVNVARVSLVDPDALRGLDSPGRRPAS